MLSEVSSLDPSTINVERTGAKMRDKWVALGGSYLKLNCA